MKNHRLSSFFLTLVVMLFSVNSLRAEEVTFDFSKNPWGLTENTSSDFTNLDKANIKQALVIDEVTAIVKYGKGTTSPRKYTDALRLYTNNILKVYAPEGKTITKIVFECQGTNFKFSEDGLTDKTWEGNATMVKFTSVGGATRLTSMVVTIADKTSETTTPAAEAEESITVDFNDNDTHKEFKNDDSEITADINVIDKVGSDGENRLYTLIPTTTSTGLFVSKNKWYYINSESKNTLRIFNEKMVFKTDPDKVIKSISMKVKTWNANNKLNGEIVSKANIQAGVEVNANEVELEVADQSVIYTITATIADKPAAEEPVVTPIVPVSFDPADNSVFNSYFTASFTAKFDEALTLDATKTASIKLYKNEIADANIIAPEAGEWTAQLQNGKKDLNIFSMDEYYEGVQIISTEEGAKYILVIPAGIVKNAAGTANEELTLTLNGPAPVIKMVSSDPADNSTKTEAFAATFNVTFDQEITVDNSKAAAVKLYVDKVGGTEIAPESGSWTLTRESDKKTLRVFSLDEYGEGPQVIVPQVGKKYILVLPAGIVKNGNSENKEIKITLNGPTVLTPIAFDPAEGSTLSSYFTASFTAKFDEALTLDNSKVANIKLYEKVGETTTELTPDDAWYASLEGGQKNLTMWCQDYDGFPQGFSAKEGAKYILVIPAGIVKNAAGTANAELTLTLNGPAPVLNLVSTTPANGDTLKAGYQAMSFKLTFSKAVSTTDNLLNRSVTLTKNGTAVEADSWGFNLSNENKTVEIFGKDMDGYTDSYKVEEGDVIVLTIAKDVFTSLDGAKSKEVKITLNGPELLPTVLEFMSSNPADGDTLKAGYHAMSFELTFAEATKTTTDKLNAGVTLTKNGSKVDVESWGFQLSNGNKTVQLFGMDMDGYTDSYKVEEGDVIVLTIAKAVFTTTTKGENEEIKITLNGPAVPVVFNPTKIEPGDGDELYKFYGNYAMPHLELTFDEKIASVLDEHPAIELHKGSVDGEKVEMLDTWQWTVVRADEPQTNMLLIDLMSKESGMNVWFPAEDVDYYWVIPAGIVKNAAGGQNEQIILKQKGVVKKLTVASTTPADKSTVTPGYKAFQFYVTFEENIEIVNAKPNDVMFYENGEKKLPYGADDVYDGSVDVWHAMKDGAKTLYIWGDDGYGFVDTYSAINGANYKLVIPAGIVKDAAGSLNDKITIEFTCSSSDGINTVKSAVVKSGERYNLNGLRINASKKGIQIVRTGDGKVLKVTVK